MTNDDSEFYEPEIIQIPIDGTLDLHTFKPKELKSLIPDYLDECIKNNIFSVRIVHGKGIGNLRRSVHAILKRLDFVEDFKLGDQSSGSWGATLVTLKRES